MKIKLVIAGKSLEISPEEAKSLYLELGSIFQAPIILEKRTEPSPVVWPFVPLIPPVRDYWHTNEPPVEYPTFTC